MGRNGQLNGKIEDVPMDNCDAKDTEVEVDMVVPPDGGWGWVIVAASFMCNLIVDGIVFSFGVFLNHIAETFQVQKSSVALVGSLQSGFYLMAGPFVSALANRYGFRPVTIIGSVVSCTAFILSFFSTSIEYLYFTYGLIGGVGAGLIYVPAVITTGFYFERWRALATGIAVCGSGIGAFVLAPVTDLLIKRFGWRNALLIQAGMLLHCAIFGAMFRPLKPSRIKVKQSDVNQDNKTVIKQETSKNSLMKNGISTNSLHASQPMAVGWIFGTNNNAEYPTAAQVIIGSNPDLGNCNRSMHSLSPPPITTVEKRLSVPTFSADIVVDVVNKPEEENVLLDANDNDHDDDPEKHNGRLPTGRRHTISSGKRITSASRDPQRPFYRDDIFYGGSLARLPHYKSQLSSVGYHMSVTRLPTATDVEEEKSGNCYICPESVRRILTTMLDLGLLKSPSFLILAISGGLTMMGFFTPFMFLPDRAKKYKLDDSTAGYLVSVIGIANTIGRVACGLASSVPGVDALTVNNIFISVSGIATIASSISPTKEYQFFYAAIFGLSVSVFAALRSILVVDLVGLEKLTNAFGLLLLFQGVAASVGAPLAGAVMEATGSYDASFYLSGSLILLSAVICYPLKRINDWEKKKLLKTDAQIEAS